MWRCAKRRTRSCPASRPGQLRALRGCTCVQKTLVCRFLLPVLFASAAVHSVHRRYLSGKRWEGYTDSPVRKNHPASGGCAFHHPDSDGLTPLSLSRPSILHQPGKSLCFVANVVLSKTITRHFAATAASR